MIGKTTCNMKIISVLPLRAKSDTVELTLFSFRSGHRLCANHRAMGTAAPMTNLNQSDNLKLAAEHSPEVQNLITPGEESFWSNGAPDDTCRIEDVRVSSRPLARRIDHAAIEIWSLLRHDAQKSDVWQRVSLVRTMSN